CRAADITRPTINMQDTNDSMRIPESDAFYVVDVLTTGTNTTNIHTVKCANIDCLQIQFAIGSVSVGSVGFELAQSLDNVTWGSITSSQMVRLTNTFQTNATATNGSSTGYWSTGDNYGTNTEWFSGTTTVFHTASGVSGNGSITFSTLRTMGSFLRVSCNHTLTGTDTARYKIVVRKATKGKI
ncbi:MAG: hypothetical protein NUV65_03200, partial [Candidatus Roizmanbacteria bacterium]|nr:hypothetical protein [Candidatus Roizmanbacteria bacterium]